VIIEPRLLPGAADRSTTWVSGWILARDTRFQSGCCAAPCRSRARGFTRGTCGRPPGAGRSTTAWRGHRGESCRESAARWQPRIHAELRDRGCHTGRKRLARLMRLRGLAARRRRRFRTTTHSRHAFPVAPTVLARQFDRAAPDQAWVTDITYIPTSEGWLYLAVILDLCSRFAVGWAMSDERAHHRRSHARRPRHGLGTPPAAPRPAASFGSWESGRVQLVVATLCVSRL
jgi:hypothetical protein